MGSWLRKIAARLAHIAENEVGLANDLDERNLAKKEMLVELENSVGTNRSGGSRCSRKSRPCGGCRTVPRHGGEGSRLIDERAAWQTRVAAQTQRNRYQDTSACP
jgi:hypothetical protein